MAVALILELIFLRLGLESSHWNKVNYFHKLGQKFNMMGRGSKVIKLNTSVMYEFCNKVEYLSPARFSSLVQRTLNLIT